MSIITQRVPSFVAWFFGPELAAKLDDQVRESVNNRPTASFGYAPEPREDAYRAGFALGLDREDAAAPGHFGPAEVKAFDSGWAAGRREWDRRLDEMFASAEWAEWSDGITDLDVHTGGVC